jgi:hypothetical protein
MSQPPPSAEIIAFPTPQKPVEDPRLRLQQALAALDAALAGQREAVAAWRGSLASLRGGMSDLRGPCHDGQTGDRAGRHDAPSRWTGIAKAGRHVLSCKKEPKNFHPLGFIADNGLTPIDRSLFASFSSEKEDSSSSPKNHCLFRPISPWERRRRKP